ncbi:hypothetical protein BC827DRAFT_1267825 [Russula dissimulans]|nr:hypothetical protein BC827DRAFT_1267825 [Russula dissimulans]
MEPVEVARHAIVLVRVVPVLAQVTASHAQAPPQYSAEDLVWQPTAKGMTWLLSRLGVCLSNLVLVLQVSGRSVPVPLPSITGIDTPAVLNPGGGRPLAWWEILLMTLGCVLIFLCVLGLFRRRIYAKAAKRTGAFAAAKNIDARGVGWCARLGTLFSHGRTSPKRRRWRCVSRFGGI